MLRQPIRLQKIIFSPFYQKFYSKILCLSTKFFCADVTQNYQWKFLCFTLFLCLICNCAVFCKKQLHLCERHAFSTACCGRFFKDHGCFQFVSGPGYRALWRIGEVALRVSWQFRGDAAAFELRAWISGMCRTFFCVCMPSARCIMLRIVGWGVYAFSVCWPVCTGVA